MLIMPLIEFTYSAALCRQKPHFLVWFMLLISLHALKGCFQRLGAGKGLKMREKNDWGRQSEGEIKERHLKDSQRWQMVRGNVRKERHGKHDHQELQERGMVRFSYLSPQVPFPLVQVSLLTIINIPKTAYIAWTSPGAYILVFHFEKHSLWRSAGQNKSTVKALVI